MTAIYVVILKRQIGLQKRIDDPDRITLGGMEQVIVALEAWLDSIIEGNFSGLLNTREALSYFLEKKALAP